MKRQWITSVFKLWRVEDIQEFGDGICEKRSTNTREEIKVTYISSFLVGKPDFK